MHFRELQRFPVRCNGDGLTAKVSRAIHSYLSLMASDVDGNAKSVSIRLHVPESIAGLCSQDSKVSSWEIHTI